MTPDFAEHEPGSSALAWETRRLWRRACRRGWLWAALCALIIIGALGATTRRPIRHTAKAVVRFTQTEPRNGSRTPWTDRSLRGYVTEVAFSQRRLLDIIERYRLDGGPGTPADPPLAISELREHIVVEVLQNRAISLLDPADRPRSAHVVIRFAHADRERARAVATDLARLVVATGQNQRRDDARQVADEAASAAENGRVRVERLRRQAARLAQELAQTDAPTAISAAREAVKAAETHQGRLEEARLMADLRLRAESERSGLDITLLDAPPPRAPWPLPRRLAAVGIGATVMALPICALLIGAFDRRVYMTDDLRRLGVPWLGHVRGPGARTRQS